MSKVIVLHIRSLTTPEGEPIEIARLGIDEGYYEDVLIFRDAFGLIGIAGTSPDGEFGQEIRWSGRILIQEAAEYILRQN